jgi:hypothetical protein
MSSIYTSFSEFMKESVRRAKNIDDFGKSDVFEIIIRILPAIGWQGFLVLAVILNMSGWAFGLSLAGFLSTPIGLIIVGILGISAAIAIKKLYSERTIPLAIKTVGDQMRPRYNELKVSQKVSAIDTLCDECARRIVFEAHTILNKSIGRKKWL